MPQEDPIKIAFQKVKQEMSYIYQEIDYIKNQIELIKIQLAIPVSQDPTNNQTNQPTNQPTNQQTQEFQQAITPTHYPTNQHIIKTNQHIIPTLQHQLEALKPQNLLVSIGNQGVPTNQPTNQQTNQHPLISTVNTQKSSFNQSINRLEKVSEILSSLDDLKKEVRLKFKKLTEQEMLVYSSIYQLEEQGFVVDYSLLSERLSLSEISIRDYIRKIIKKGIPLNKSKENNKKISLTIPQDLKKIASLNTIVQLRKL